MSFPFHPVLNSHPCFISFILFSSCGIFKSHKAFVLPAQKEGKHPVLCIRFHKLYEHCLCPLPLRAQHWNYKTSLIWGKYLIQIRVFIFCLFCLLWVFSQKKCHKCLNIGRFDQFIDLNDMQKKDFSSNYNRQSQTAYLITGNLFFQNVLI